MRWSRADRRVLAAVCLSVLGGLAVWGGPKLLLAWVTAAAARCVGPRWTEEAPGACAATEDRLAKLSAVPWIHHDATYRYEELRARLAILAYREAATGTPDAAARARAAGVVARHEEFVEEGSSRLRLEELGRPEGAPKVGALALELGDRDALLERYDSFGAWPVRLGVLRAALLEGALEKADVVAARYAEFDPRDADLRGAVGAILCLGPDPGRGLDVLARIPADRADKRHAAMARNFGEIRAVQEACADLAGIEPPPPPIERHAGVADAEEARATQALRLAQGPEEVRDARRRAVELLEGAAPPHGGGLSPGVPAARISLLAELLVSGEIPPAPTLLRLATPRAGEVPLLPAGRLDATRIAREPLTDGPVVTADTFSRAAGLVGRAAEASPELAPVAAALELRAAVGLARQGRHAEAAQAAARAAPALAPARVALLEASLAALAADLPRATAAAAGQEKDRATWLALALAAASAGKHEDAERAVARARAAESPEEPDLEVELRLWELAVSRDVSGRAGRLDAWAGFAEPGGRWRDQRATSLEALEPLAHAIGGDEAARREARRRFSARRGDAPDALGPWTLALGRLGPGEAAAGSAAEVWLDAALCVDEPRFSLREVAGARALAARWRGDAEAARRWSDRQEALRGLLADPRRAVIARFLGI